MFFSITNQIFSIYKRTAMLWPTLWFGCYPKLSITSYFFNVSVTFQFKSLNFLCNIKFNSLNFLLYRIFKKSTVHMRHRWWQILKTLISLLVSHHKLSMLFTLGTDTVGLLCLCEQILLILKHPPPPHTQIKLRSAINTRIQNRSVKYGIA